MTAQSLQSGVTVYDDFIKSEECHLNSSPPLPPQFPSFFLALVLTFAQQLTITRRCSLIRTRPSDAFMHAYAYTAISSNVFGKSARDNPERYNCGWFWVHYSSEKFERMAREAMDVRLRVVKRKQQYRGTQREYSSKPLKHSIVKRTLVFKR